MGVSISVEIGSGKSTIARLLALRFLWRAVSLAAALKGCSFSICGVLSFFPQQGVNARTALFQLGELARKKVNPHICFKARLQHKGFRVINPAATVSGKNWTKLVASRILDSASAKLVNTNLSDIAKADAGLFFLEKPSIGASPEMFAMRLQGKPIVIAVPLSLFYHPWLRVFGKVIWNESVPRLSEYNVAVLKS